MSNDDEAREIRLARAQIMLSTLHDDEIVFVTGCSYEEVLGLRAERAAGAWVGKEAGATSD